MFNKYYKRWDTGVDEELFGKTERLEVTNGPRDSVFISGGYKQKADDLFESKSYVREG